MSSFFFAFLVPFSTVRYPIQLPPPPPPCRFNQVQGYGSKNSSPQLARILASLTTLRIHFLIHIYFFMSLLDHNVKSSPFTFYQCPGNTNSQSVKSRSRHECVVLAVKVHSHNSSRLPFATEIVRSADRRPIDPPPIIQLRVIDPTASRRPTGSSPGSAPSSPMSDSSPVSRFVSSPC